jgi:hypothetical protein
MDDVRLSRYPQLTWTSFRLWLPSGERRLSFQIRSVSFGISIALDGSRSATQVTHGRQRGWSETAGMVSCVPADGDQHTYLMDSDAGCELFAVLIPPSHLTTVTEAEGLKAFDEWSPMLGVQDAVMRDCMARLAATPTSHDTAEDLGIDEVARRLILRLVALTGGGKPDWHDDASIFDRRTLFNLVAYLDEHLRIAPSLSDMALLSGLSPSHFTRLFSSLTGMTPSKYQKSVRRTVG